MKNILSNKFAFLTALVFGAALTRLLPHYPNFTAIGAAALFGGACFEKKWMAVLVPFAALFLTDAIIGFHTTMFAVYLSFGITILIGLTLRERKSILTVAGGSVISSVIFFVVTNFAVWGVEGYYPKNTAGLSACFTAAIPFFGTTLLGDLLFTAVLFGSLALAKKKIPALSLS